MKHHVLSDGSVIFEFNFPDTLQTRSFSRGWIERVEVIPVSLASPYTPEIVEFDRRPFGWFETRQISVRGSLRIAPTSRNPPKSSDPEAQFRIRYIFNDGQVLAGCL